MKQSGVRYVVERRCKPENKHDLELGYVPIAAKQPEKIVQKLIQEVERCPDCTFHSKFYPQDYNDLIDQDEINEIEANKYVPLLKWTSFLSFICVGVILLFNLFTHGLLHAISVLSVSMFTFFGFVSYDAWSSKSLSGVQKANIIVNMLLLCYAFAVLPTNEAIQDLIKLGTKQTLFEGLFLK